jgi:hypothetical protein
MTKTAKILFVCAVVWEAASILWFKNPFRHDFSPVGWFCITLGILCALGGVAANRRR